jgi:NADPH:quinone reductase-like Zn-dependent oxidoreductase
MRRRTRRRGQRLQPVRDGGRLATITSDPREPDRGIGISSMYVRPNAGQLDRAIQALGGGRVDFKLGARFPLAQAGAALEHAIRGAGGAVALEL